MHIVVPSVNFGLVPNIQQIPAAEAARILGVDVRTIHRMIRRGQLRGKKVHEGLRAPFLVSKTDVDSVFATRAQS